jgi:hypothetical protein
MRSSLITVAILFAGAHAVNQELLIDQKPSTTDGLGSKATTNGNMG